MLINCPECNKRISDKAIACPSCGLPMTKANKSSKRKRRRLPNGFGQITELKNRNLRKPFRVMVTVGKNENGRPICKLLKPESYFKTYNEAYKALMLYQSNPCDLQLSMTMDDLFNEWVKSKEGKVHSHTWNMYSNYWDRAGDIRNKLVVEIRTKDVKDCISQKSLTANASRQLKNMLNMMLDFGITKEIVEKNYARITEATVTLEDAKNPHISFTEDELNKLWDVFERENVKGVLDMVLICCYGGWRPMELIEMRVDSIDFEKNIIINGSKTEAGRNRTVPIHPRIREMLRKRYNEAVEANFDYVFMRSYRDRYQRTTFFMRFKAMLKELNMSDKHRPHDCRKTFVTMAKKYGVDEYSLKLMVGHAITDITEKVYTQRDPEWLMKEIIKIP